MLQAAQAPPSTAAVPPDDPVRQAVFAVQAAQRQWGAVDVRRRLAAVAACRRALVASPREWAEEITTPGVRSAADSLAAEVLPTADACRFLERNAQRLLRERRAAGRDRPIWGRGLRVRVRREPLGVVLVIGAGNYPLFLSGVQTLQAAAAGNGVLIKPAPGASAPMRRLAGALESGGMPAGLVQVLDESPKAATRALELGVGKVVLTGSAATGRKVMAKAAQTLTPCTMELSGCDAVFVLPGADLDRVAAAIAFGLRLNGGATCIGPKRLYVPESLRFDLMERIALRTRAIPPTVIPPQVAAQAERLVTDAISGGAEPLFSPSFQADRFAPILLDAPPPDAELLRADLFAPVISLIPIRDADEALELNRLCPYGLGASVFGPADAAEAFANRVEAGCVTVNDLVAPTADPRVPFGGWNESGFGVTRGAEGLLEMTRPKAVVSQRAGWLPHLDPPREKLDQLVVGLLRMSHGRGLTEKWRGLRDVIAGSKK
ncbi:MAG: aldehyde dehydrogenase family protein [Planctomycetota bacterium]